MTRIAPGVKTNTVAFLGFVGNAAYAAKDYIAGLPLERVVTVEKLMILNVILFTLAFWFKGMGQRVSDRVDA